ncbi:MAG: alcohol acetyltransferase [Clostridia bacterium]|nr:alcohol acetyltransferase [Clostridia bacterium]
MKSKIPLHQRTWYKLDNAGKVYPGQNTSSWSSVFRISVTLKEKVNPQLLEKALELTLPRFPGFDVRMRNGFFWHYLEKNPNGAPPVLPDAANPCLRVKWKENRGYLFRVFYYEKRISVEFYHAIADGYGASKFFMTLVAVYLRQTGLEIPNGESVLDISENPHKTEFEDSYLKNVNSKAKAKRLQKFTYNFKGKKLPKHFFNVTTGYIPVDKLKEKAAEHGATVTEYIAAVLVWVMYNLQKEEKRKKEKRIGVQIPVNVRKYFGSETLRNFMLCYSFQIDPNMGEYTFPEIVRQVSLYLRYINNEKEIQAMMNSNTGIERNPIMRILPSVLKDFGISVVYKFAGEKGTSAIISNVGVVKVPEEMEPHIEKFMYMMGPGMVNAARCIAVSQGGTFAMSISNIYESTLVQKEIFTTLVKFGIPVKIESNRHSIKGGEK